MNQTQTFPAERRVLQLDSYWPYQLTVLADHISRHTAAIVKRHAGLNLSQWRVMAAIAERPGRTAAEVVAVTPMDKGIVSRATKALLEAGLVVRTASQDDGRISHLHLTDGGEAVYQSLVPRVESVSIQAQSALGAPERQQFETSLKRLSSLLLQLGPDDQPDGTNARQAAMDVDTNS
ncbi:MarR family winged helix-turn-helix transcriptional regulator [Maricaulis sp.]|uniref:MarR family winged helix-turn-helix transcriptional regulator n=1 Tax=Maricaulis sp. TaxID=1486257 RepID=UPI003A90D410